MTHVDTIKSAREQRKDDPTGSICPNCAQVKDNNPNQNQELWSTKTTECNWPDTFKFADQLNKEKHLNRTNWRVPKLWELLKAHELKIEGFDRMSWYWSSSSHVNISYGYGVWIVYPGTGKTDYSSKYNIKQIRCVAPPT